MTQQPNDPIPPVTTSDDDTMSWVGSDRARAKQVLDRENSSDNPRPSLIEKLKSLVK